MKDLESRVRFVMCHLTPSERSYWTMSPLSSMASSTFLLEGFVVDLKTMAVFILWKLGTNILPEMNLGLEMFLSRIHIGCVWIMDLNKDLEMEKEREMEKRLQGLAKLMVLVICGLCKRALKISFNLTQEIMINNVGTNIRRPVVEFTAKEYATLFATNFKSVFHMCQLAHPLLKTSGAGSVVFISSVSGFVSLKSMSVHGATKEDHNQIYNGREILVLLRNNYKNPIVARGVITHVSGPEFAGALILSCAYTLFLIYFALDKYDTHLDINDWIVDGLGFESPRTKGYYLQGGVEFDEEVAEAAVVVVEK
ncbi:hypothetical protein ACSBR1_033969 [Camellia fascicularis]